MIAGRRLINAPLFDAPVASPPPPAPAPPPVKAEVAEAATGEPKPCKEGTFSAAVLAALMKAEGGWVGGDILCHPEVGGWRFGAYVWDLRKKGYVIENEPSEGKSWHKYRLVGGR